MLFSLKADGDLSVTPLNVLRFHVYCTSKVGTPYLFCDQCRADLLLSCAVKVLESTRDLVDNASEFVLDFTTCCKRAVVRAACFLRVRASLLVGILPTR